MAQIRKALELAQTEVAAALNATQPEVSKIEKRSDIYLSTLAKYVAALGGELEMVAVVGGDRFPISLAVVEEQRTKETAAA